MNPDPFNQLPADPEWVKGIDAACEKLALEFGCMMVCIGIQEGGKMGVAIADNDKQGEQREFYELIQGNVPMLFLQLARYAALVDSRPADPKERH